MFSKLCCLVIGYRRALRRELSTKFPQLEVDLSKADRLLTELEKYPFLSKDIIEETGLGKLFRNLIKENQMPVDEVYNFRKRMRALLGRWGQNKSQIQANK
jgi:hypothetical protein